MYQETKIFKLMIISDILKNSRMLCLFYKKINLFSAKIFVLQINYLALYNAINRTNYLHQYLEIVKLHQLDSCNSCCFACIPFSWHYHFRRRTS